MSITTLRRKYHQQICTRIIRINAPGQNNGYPNFSDGSNLSSVQIAWGIFTRLGCNTNYDPISGQTAGQNFETATKDFLEQAFALLHHLRPGNWLYRTQQTAISAFDQYEHLARLEQIVVENHDLASALGGDYIIRPDIVIGRYPVTDEEINLNEPVLGIPDAVAQLTPLRANNSKQAYPILHASISCKWTIRSDRSQNTRTEALNLMRNRKGRVPHIVAVTAEPLPTRIAALALGTGDLDCVYHFALPELESAIAEIGNEDQYDMLKTLIEGRRLRDISDLPFDLVV